MPDGTTIRRYEKDFKKNGVDGILENKYSRSESFSTTKQQEELTLHLKDQTYQTVKETISYVQARYLTKIAFYLKMGIQWV